ncbi:NR LBD domain-containing protein [Caenorhabditis elegans]|uniref:NR LBD domain-containing protein n=2 Tax=Caenorhabditis elegans TaxID=6239 RepID=Q9NEV6_CAEEL|nr:NR LBD domain-containing protein [Caenorhabditis elegans]CAC51060.3 NR LBD domain-containing protein [Caenorhabditis elegans]|eukprot:NP_001256841.1 Nuclear Hormone Receptor family [Caenorhabditis elegans]
MNPEKQCQICAKTSNGMHFGAMTCRACAAFFRRAVVLKLEYSCKAKKMCQLEGGGRSMCRYCRFEKCKEIGMDAEKVILDYDPTASQKVPVMPKIDKVQENEPAPATSKSHADKITVKIDFTELTEKLKEMFETQKRSSGELSGSLDSDESSTDSVYLNDLQNLTKALNEFQAPIKDKKDIVNLDRADMKKVIYWLNFRVKKYATWYSHATYLIEHLPMNQKFETYRKSWNLLRMFERIAMTWKHYGNEMFEGHFILVSDDTKMIIDKSLIHFEEISDVTDEYFRRLFHPFLNQYMEEVAKPMSELDLTTEEIVFCMVNILGYDASGLTPETIETLHKFKEIIADQMHSYYTNSTNIKMYSHRIMKLMQLVKSITKIAREKSRLRDVIYVFDIYKAEISDPCFFQFF